MDTYTSILINFLGFLSCLWAFCSGTNFSYGTCHQNFGRAVAATSETLALTTRASGEQSGFEQLKNYVHLWAMDEMGSMLAASKTACMPATNFPNALATMPRYSGEDLRKKRNDLKYIF